MKFWILIALSVIIIILLGYLILGKCEPCKCSEGIVEEIDTGQNIEGKIILEPDTVLCGIKERDTTPKNTWVGEPVNCKKELLNNDSEYFNIYGDDIQRDNITAIEIGFDLSDYKEIQKAEVTINMLCTSSLSTFTLTEFDEWKPLKTTYEDCDPWVKVRSSIKITPIINNKYAYILITPGTGNSEGNINQVSIEIS